MLNVLLTGGAGFIGSHTAVALAAAGHRVVVFDNFSNSQRAVVQQIDRVIEQTALGQTAASQSVASQTAGSAPAASQTAASAPAVGPAASGQPVVVIEGDVRDTALLARTLAGQAIDAVVHFAGLKAVGESVAKPIDYYANNVQGTISLLQAMQQSRCNTLVFSSSATVYGDPQYLPLDESHPTGATNPYARSKLHIEGMLADLGRADPAWRLAVLRYFNPVGAHPSGLIPQQSDALRCASRHRQTAPAQGLWR